MARCRGQAPIGTPEIICYWLVCCCHKNGCDKSNCLTLGWAGGRAGRQAGKQAGWLAGWQLMLYC